MLGHILLILTPITIITLGTSEVTEDSDVKGVIIRLIGIQKSHLFRVTIFDKSDENHGTVRLYKLNNIVNIEASSKPSAAYGFHYYLKYYCNCHISWDHDTITIPDTLPDVNITLSANSKYRYYQNVCTYSYSYVWWDWKRWERELDWMSLNGINLALAFTSQEFVWDKVFKKFNLTKSEINSYFTGPAFLAWNRMGNIKGWGGGLTLSWHTKALELQMKILERMRSLGITPILPCFAAYLPNAFKRIYPNASFVLSDRWANFSDEFCCPLFANPADSVFFEIGYAFVTEVVRIFGTDHMYGCDPFNEMIPQRTDETYLNQTSTAIYKILKAADPKATWVLQGWMFANGVNFWTRKRAYAFLSPVPNHAMLILDLQSELIPQYERLDSYFGKNFVWCMLHNFGGTLGMHGSANRINDGIYKARKLFPSTFSGVGLTPEGINQNYVMYDYAIEFAWRENLINHTEWFRNYANRRYGTNNDDSQLAWILLKESVYNLNSQESIHGQYVMCVRPSLKLTPSIWYDVKFLFVAFESLLKLQNTHIRANENYLHDLTDVSRQILQVIFERVYFEMINSYKLRQIEKFTNLSRALTDILTDAESILATRKNFKLGLWLESANASAFTNIERNLLMRYALYQITLWGPNGEILDYATKQWSGVVVDYYLPRWKLFIEYLRASLIEASEFDEKLFKLDVFNNVEKQFANTEKVYSSEPEGDTIVIANYIFKKWSTRLF